jgi:hypothetical protein
MIGRILEIFDNSSSSQAIVVIDYFDLSAERHFTFGMPTLSRQYDEQRIVIVPTVVSTHIRWSVMYLILDSLQGYNVLSERST